MTELTLEESLSMFMAEIGKRHDEHSNLIKELRASTDFALRNQKASIKTLEIEVRQMSIILHKKLSRNLQSSTKIKPRINDETISTSVETDKPSIRRIDASQYAVLNIQNRNLFSESKEMTLPSPSHLNDDYWDELKETDGVKDLEAYYTNAKTSWQSLASKGERLREMVKRPKGIVENVLVGIDKFTFLVDFIILDIPEDFKTPLILGRPFLSTAHAIVFKAKITLSVRNDKIFFKIEARLMDNALRKNRSHDPKLEDYIELSDLNEPLELRHDQVVNLGPTIEEGEVIDTPIKEMVKTRHDDDKITNGIEDYPSFSDLDRKIHVNDAYNLRFFSMIDKLEFKGKTIVGAFMNAPIFVGTFSVVTNFAVIENMDRYRDEEMGDIIVGKEFCKEIRREVIEIESFKSSTQHSSVNDFVVINIPKEDVKPKQIILDPDDQPMWESAKTVAPTPNSAIIQLDVDDNFVINSTRLNMIRENKFDGYLLADPHDRIGEFLAISDMFKYGETQSEAVKLFIFPFSLCDKAKTWFNELNKESITSWDQMRRVFINRFFPPLLFNYLLFEIRSFSQLVCEILTDAWLRLKSMLQKCHGHGLTKGAIIQLFYHGLDKPTQGILNVTAGGIFLYKSSNQAFQLLEDKVLFNLDWSTKSKNEHHQKSVASADGKLQDMREKYNELRNGNASKNNMNNDTPMYEHHEANYIQSEGYENQNSHDSHSHQSHHDRNDSEKSLTELNNDVRNDFEDFKRCIHSMRTVHWKLFAKDDGKTTSVLPKKKSKPVNQEPQP
ncbi:reverse transcriptase domain-containing protein [Tanacetum coccineum]